MAFSKDLIGGIDTKIAVHAALKQNVHGVGAHDIQDSSDVALKLNKSPDYDSGCISIGAGSNIELTHNLNTRDLLIQVLNSLTDNDCMNDATSGTGLGRPLLASERNINYFSVFCNSVNKIDLHNSTAATGYFRVFLWKVN